MSVHAGLNAANKQTEGRLKHFRDSWNRFPPQICTFELTEQQERWERWAETGRPGTRFLLYMNFQTSRWTLWPTHVAQSKWGEKNKLEYGLLATDLTLISEVSLHLAASPDGGRQGDVATWLRLPLQSPLRGRWQCSCCLLWQIVGEEACPNKEACKRIPSCV